MNWPASPPPAPAVYEKHREVLLRFQQAWRFYVNAFRTNSTGDPRYIAAQRTEAILLAVPAEQAVNSSGLRMRLSPPPVAAGHPVLTSFSQIAFAFENPVYQPLMRDAPDSVVLTDDAIQSAYILLEQKAARARKWRRNPCHWIDLGLRSALGFPAYLLSVVFNFNVKEVPKQGQQALWLLSLLADGVTVTKALRLW